MYDQPHSLPERTACLRCEVPTPTMADRMCHDELHASPFEMEDS
jgi:hypothetical protein